MARKPSKKKSTGYWECDQGCPLLKEPCEHLERLLPKPKKPLFTIGYNEDRHNVPRVKYISPEEREVSFRKWLAQYALPEEAVDFLIARMIDDKPLEVVAKEQHFTNKQAAHRFENWIKDTLKARGLKLKGGSS